MGVPVVQIGTEGGEPVFKTCSEVLMEFLVVQSTVNPELSKINELLRQLKLTIVPWFKIKRFNASTVFI